MGWFGGPLVVCASEAGRNGMKREFGCGLRPVGAIGAIGAYAPEGRRNWEGGMGKRVKVGVG